MVEKTRSNFATAKEMYPILEGLEYDIVETPDEEGPYGLEHFSPGEEGSAERPRPDGIPLERYGLHVFKTTKPEDIAGDIISHRLVNSDPYLSERYKKFKEVTSPEVMERRYDWHKKNLGEKRDYNLWAETTGFPELLRGHVFNQFPKEAKDKLYTDEQKQILEDIKTRVTKPNKFNKGGMPMPMGKQMEMFEDGGLADEGGTTDEMSGNDVPVGSLKEEVRDDIPAQLSEGEFVLPADVVRYHGLDKIMKLRDEAKAGLSRMEDMGQMGNSEKAILPDGMPFNMEDLEMDEDSVSNDMPFNSDDLEMNVGGLVPQQQPYGVVPQTTNTYNIPSAFSTYQQQPYSQQNVVAPVTPVTTTVPGFVQPPIAPRSQFTFKDLMPGTVRRQQLNLAGQTGAPQVDTSGISRSNAATNAPTGSNLGTDLATAAVTGYTAYKIAPSILADAKKAYGTLKSFAGSSKVAADAAASATTMGPGTVAPTFKSLVPGTVETSTVGMGPQTTYAGTKAAAAKSSIFRNPLTGTFKGSAASTAAGLAMFAAIVGMGAFGMPSGKANHEKYKRERRDKRIKEVIVPMKQMLASIAGVSSEKLIASQQPPKTPWQDMEDDIRASGVGDMDNELDTAKTMFQSNPVFQKQNEEFLAQGDNAKWYNPDMSRTDYMGEIYENNAALRAIAEASKNSFVAGTRLPTGTPNPVLVAQEQYTKHIEAGGEPNTFMPNFEPKEKVEKETTTETDGT